jgi:hypothetical protein
MLCGVAPAQDLIQHHGRLYHADAERHGSRPGEAEAVLGPVALQADRRGMDWRAGRHHVRAGSSSLGHRLSGEIVPRRMRGGWSAVVVVGAHDGRRWAGGPGQGSTTRRRQVGIGSAMRDGGRRMVNPAAVKRATRTSVCRSCATKILPSF